MDDQNNVVDVRTRLQARKRKIEDAAELRDYSSC
jgi:hypothetical protein